MRPSMDHLAAAFAQRPAKSISSWQSSFQNEAWQRAKTHGLPWRKDEHWKYTSMFALSKLELQVASSTESGVDKQQFIYNDEQAYCLTWQNGKMVGDTTLPAGVSLQTPDGATDFLNRAPTRFSVMQDLNHAFAEHIYVLNIAANTRLDKPLYLLHQLTGSNTLSSPRLHIVVGDNCEFDLVDHVLGDGHDNVNNRRITIDIGANSQVRHTQVQQESVGTSLLDNIDVTVAWDAHYVSQVFDLGAGLARHDLGIALNDANANCTMLAVFLPHLRQHVDHHTIVHHNQPQTHSVQRYHGVAGIHGHGVFNGKVLVQKDAQKITAQQSNQNILLCEQAAIDTKPELEIYADDVKCSHGATIGQLDETALFYLQSRGLDRREAQQVLVQGFVRDVYASISCAHLHSWLDQAITRKLDQLVEQLP